MKSIIYIIFLLLMANSYAAVGIPVNEKKFEFNECGESEEQEDSSDTICIDLNNSGCDAGTIAKSTTQGIICTGYEVENFLQDYELAEYY